MRQQVIDQQNAAFWDELCGTQLARSLGIEQFSRQSLQRFDETYLSYYPYLGQYVERERLKGKKVLEIGLGFGTLSQLLASKDCEYHGLDIAPNPVAMVRARLSLLGLDPGNRVREGSALAIPFEDGTFDFVYSIGCLHHTGDLARAVAEVHRVLAGGGKAVIMLYHKHSLRRLVRIPMLKAREWWSRASPRESSRQVRAMYDVNSRGEAAPHTDYVSRREVRRLFSSFSRTRVDSQNMDPLILLRGRVVIPRHRLLGTLGRVVGLDLYVEACK